jgi:Xaa-Pro dipeptidase
LFYDFRRSNDLACKLLEVPQSRLLTRRFFYWIPQKGEPVKIVSAIEDKILQHLPGNTKIYRTWQELESFIGQAVKGLKKVAMEYSPRNAVPYISKVDGGTIDLIRSFRVEVVSSGDILQEFTNVWDEHKLKTHLAAAEILNQTVDKVWEYLSQSLKLGRSVTETEVQKFILREIEENGCITADPPICAVNENSADPHYSPRLNHDRIIKPQDFILIDLWCKQDLDGAAYADITRVAVADSSPTKDQKLIFDIVRNAQKAAVQFIEQRLKAHQSILGWEVDQACRNVIEKAGYGANFIHRTGHNIDESDHGNGTHLDNYETQDERELLPGTCFSIEPGIYLPERFGIRLEHDAYIHLDFQLQITGGIQNEITCI